jgi:hypothetical protein
VALGDRIRRLEDAQGVGRVESEGDTRRRRVMDRMYHTLENGRRELEGRDPLPDLPEAPLEDTKTDIMNTLSRTIPHYRQHGGWRRGEGKEFLDRWQDRLLAQLANLESGENDA